MTNPDNTTILNVDRNTYAKKIEEMKVKQSRLVASQIEPLEKALQASETKLQELEHLAKEPEKAKPN